MSETPETLAQGRGEVGLTVGNRLVSGVNPASDKTVLQTDASGNITADQNIKLLDTSDPGKPAAGFVTIYARAVSGSTVLFARFNQGAEQQIAAMGDDD